MPTMLVYPSWNSAHSSTSITHLGKSTEKGRLSSCQPKLPFHFPTSKVARPAPVVLRIGAPREHGDRVDLELLSGVPQRESTGDISSSKTLPFTGLVGSRNRLHCVAQIQRQVRRSCAILAEVLAQVCDRDVLERAGVVPSRVLYLHNGVRDRSLVELAARTPEIGIQRIRVVRRQVAD
jgi:hypothetical protein